MYRTTSVLALALTLVSLLPTTLAAPTTARAVENKCPWEEYACFDVINSSLCLSQQSTAGNPETMAACVTYDGAMSDLPGAQKVSTLWTHKDCTDKSGSCADAPAAILRV